MRWSRDAREARYAFDRARNPNARDASEMVEPTTVNSRVTRLRSLSLGFRYPQSQPNIAGRLPPPLTRVVFLALTEFWFTGDSEYLEDILPRIDTPLLCEVDITFFDQPAFDTPSLRDFISRTEIFKAPLRAHMTFSQLDVTVMLFHQNGVADHRKFQLGMSDYPPGWERPSNGSSSALWTGSLRAATKTNFWR